MKVAGEQCSAPSKLNIYLQSPPPPVGTYGPASVASCGLPLALIAPLGA